MAMGDGEETVIHGRRVHREDVLGVRGAPVYHVEGFPELTLMQAEITLASLGKEGGDE